MNGFEFLEVFRTLSVEKRNSAKIVVLSSSNNPVDIARAMKLGATQYLTKPLTEDMLSGVLLNGNERTEAA
jgi:CheY-like chemotaxis protein